MAKNLDIDPLYIEQTYNNEGQSIELEVAAVSPSSRVSGPFVADLTEVYNYYQSRKYYNFQYTPSYDEFPEEP